MSRLSILGAIQSSLVSTILTPEKTGISLYPQLSLHYNQHRMGFDHEVDWVPFIESRDGMHISSIIGRTKLSPDRRGRSLRRLFVEPLENRRLMAVIDLATLTASQGTTILGAEPGDFSGSSVSSAGDVNGDGYDDFVIGASEADALGNSKNRAGESYVIFGGPSPPTFIDLASLGTAGFTILGADAYDRSGTSVSSAGDVNGDGFDDLLVGATGGDGSLGSKSYSGESYIVYGKANWTGTSIVDLANLGNGGTTIFGTDANDQSGNSVSGAGDVNGDGFDDVIVGAARAASVGNSKSNAGESYVLFGAATMPLTIDLANLIVQQGFTVFGANTNDSSGISVSAAGDVNGDGFGDLIIGAEQRFSGGAGRSYLIFGQLSFPSTISLTSTGLPAGIAGSQILGTNGGDRLGFSVSGAGDFDGDGFDDLIVGAPIARPVSTYRGESHIIFGSATLTRTIQCYTLNQAGQPRGIWIRGAETDDQAGYSVSHAGDVNGDGFDDVIVSANLADAIGNAKSSAGDSYLIFGRATPPNAISLFVNSPSVVNIYGADANDNSGHSVSDGGDVNGDGFDDLLIGARSARPQGNGTVPGGKSYLLYGNNDFSLAVTHLGTSASETLVGTTSSDTIVGGGGNDTLYGNLGADVLIGGQGNDTFITSTINNLAFKRVVGGTGIDTLKLDGGGLALDLTTLADNRVLGIEKMDLSGPGFDTLTLNYREALNLSDESNTLVVKRSSGDIIHIRSGWTQGINEMIDGDLYAVFTQGAATLKLQEVPASILHRRVFYNRPVTNFYGDSSGNPESLIDTSVSPVRPGQTALELNYTNYYKGLNGLVIDVASLRGTPTAADFQFAIFDGSLPLTFTNPLAIPTVTVFPGGGDVGTSRIKIEFDDYAIRNTWLRVTMLANSNTGLLADDVFYFGNAVGDLWVGNVGSPKVVRTNATDTSAVRQNQSIAIGSAGFQNRHDLNKDGRVNATDTSIVRQNQLASIIRFFDAPANFLASDEKQAVDSIMADSSWQDEFRVDTVTKQKSVRRWR